MINLRRILPAALSALFLLAGSGCALLKPRPSAPAITVGRTNQAPTGLSARLRENFGIRETKPAPAPAPTPSVGTPAATPPTATNSSAPATAYKMRVGDTIFITLRDLPDARNSTPIEDIIDDSGTVNLPLIGRMTAAGKTTSVLEQEIEKKYKDEQYYKHLTVSVVIPQRIFFVTGEVRQSNKFPLTSGVTLSQGVATAGGYTDFADPKKTQLIRAGRTTIHNLIEIQKDPTKDVPLEAGDQIVVPKSWY